MKRFIFVFLCAGIFLVFAGQDILAEHNENAIWNEYVKVEVLKKGSDGCGFSVFSGKTKVTDVELTSGKRWTAKEIRTGGDNEKSWMELKGISTEGTGRTPTLGPSSYVRVEIAKGKKYPKVEFLFDIQKFDADIWKSSFKPDAPMYFLRASLPSATMIYLGGTLIATPKVEKYPLSRKGLMSANWSDKWTYAAAMAGFTVPSFGLWDDEGAGFVAYDFGESFHTDKSCKFIAVASCLGEGDHDGQFFCLVWPWQDKWTNLTYSDKPAKVSSHFELVYSLEIPAWKDPNQFVLERFFNEHSDLVMPVPKMNDIQWLETEEQAKLNPGLDRTSRYPGIIGKTGTRGLQGAFVEVGSEWLGNEWAADGVWGAYSDGNTVAINKLKQDLKRLMDTEAVWVERNREKCVSWNLPLSGKMLDRWGGKDATGIYHSKTWQVGALFIGAYANEKDPAYLPFIDGVYNWTKYHLWTRNGVCDLPWAMFCRVGTAAGENFMLPYRRVFKDDPVRSKNYDEALELARKSIYKVLWTYTTDPDETDLMDPVFQMCGVNDNRWIGRVTWNECSYVIRTLILLYCETADPIMKYYVRGIMDRHWVGYREDGGNAENVDIFGIRDGGKGVRTAGFPEPHWYQLLRRYALPIAGATMRAVAGEKAAIAFCKGTRDYDISDYCYEQEANFSFKVVNLRPDKTSGTIDIMVSAPNRDLRNKKIYVNNIEIPADRYEFNERTDGEDVYIWGVKPGDIIRVGELKQQKPFELKEIKVFSNPTDTFISMYNFECVNLAGFSNYAPELGWWKENSWFGLVPGEHWVYGVPLFITDPQLNNDKSIVEGNKKPITIPVNRSAKALFFFVGTLDSDYDGYKSLGRFKIEYAGGEIETVDANEPIFADITCYMPLRNWTLYVVMHRTNPAVIKNITVEKGKLIALTLGNESSKDIESVLARLQEEIENVRFKKSRHTYYVPSKVNPRDWKWWNNSWRYRTLLEITSKDYDRENEIVKLKQDFSLLLGQVGEKGNFDPNPIRVVEYDESGKILKEVPAQFDLLPDKTDKGELVFVMPGGTKINNKRYFCLYFNTAEKPGTKAKCPIKYSVSNKILKVNAGSSGLQFEFNLSGEGSGPRFTSLIFEGNNVLGPAGFSGGYGALTAVQDGVTWFDFGALQEKDAEFQVVQEGPASLTFCISGLELYGAGTGKKFDALGTKGTGEAGLKGTAKWYFQFYAGIPVVDQWVEYNIKDSDTSWTRGGVRVRYGLNKWEKTDFSKKPNYTFTDEIGAIALDEAIDRPDISATYTKDGNVIEVFPGAFKGPGDFYTDKWRMTKGALSQEEYLSGSSPVFKTQYAVEVLDRNVVKKNVPTPSVPEFYSTVPVVAGLKPGEKKKLPVWETGVLNPDPYIRAQEIPSTSSKYWAVGGDGWWSTVAYSGDWGIDLTLQPGKPPVVVQTNTTASKLMNVQPNKKYLCSFMAMSKPPGPAYVMTNFYAGTGYDFKQIKVDLIADGKWHKYEVEVPTGNFSTEDAEPGKKIFRRGQKIVPVYRIWTISQPQNTYVDDIMVKEKK